MADWYILEKVKDKNNQHSSADITVFSCYSLIRNMTSHHNLGDLQEVPLNIKDISCAGELQTL
jgi:hypothetical protein